MPKRGYISITLPEDVMSLLQSFQTTYKLYHYSKAQIVTALILGDSLINELWKSFKIKYTADLAAKHDGRHDDNKEVKP